MSTLIRDLSWTGMLKWDPDAHPRWPAGSADSTGGEFAPRGAGGGTGADSRDAHGQLADAAISDASNDAVAEAVRAAAQRETQRRSAERDSAPNLILASAEDEKEPRFGMGHNGPPEDLIPQRLIQSPAGPVVQFFDNLLDISGPGDDANLAATELQMRALLNRIHAVDPHYVYESIDPPGGLAGMSWQGRRNAINGLRADLAAAIYRKCGDIRPLQEVTFEFLQRATNEAYDEAIQQYEAGRVRLSREEAIGNYVDRMVRARLRGFFNANQISTSQGSDVEVNMRAYDTSGTNASYRIPDARVGNLAFEVSLTAKLSSYPQIRGFLNADFVPAGVIIVRPNQLGNESSYVIWRAKGH